MMKSRIFIVVMAVVMFIGLVSCENQKDEAKTEKITPKEQWAEDSKYSFKDDVLTTKNAKMVITGTKVFLPEEDISLDDIDGSGRNKGKKLIAFYYDITNISGKDIYLDTAWNDCVEAQQKIGTVATPLNRSNWTDGAFADAFYTAKPGETAKCAVAYILEDDKAPVTLVATKEKSLAGDDFSTKDIGIGEATYPVK